MSSKDQVTEAEVFKSIGKLEESTSVMKREMESSQENEEKVVSFLTFIGKVIKGILVR